MERESKDLKLQISFLVISLFLSVIIGFIPLWTGVTFTTADQILLSFVSFVSLSVLNIIWLTSNLKTTKDKFELDWSIKQEGDSELANIKTAFHEILREANGQKDRYVKHFLREFQRLGTLIKDAAEKKELLIVKDHLISVNDVLEAFSGDPNPIYRYTWPIYSPERLFTIIAWKRFFQVTADMIRSGQLKEIRTLLIVNDLTFITFPHIEKMLEFYKTNKNIDCRVIERETFEIICSDNEISTSDFGIYGNKLLYLTRQDIPPETIGMFTKDQNQIDAYIHFFDTVWNFPGVAKEGQSKTKKRITAQEVIDFDDIHYKKMLEESKKSD